MDKPLWVDQGHWRLPLMLLFNSVCVAVLLVALLR
jgi:hypothetical protein